MRLILLAICLLIIDYYAFQAVRIATINWPKSIRVGSYIIYFLGSLLCYLYIAGQNLDTFTDNQKTLVLYLRAFVFILFLSKFLVALFLVIDDVRRLFLLIANQFSSNDGFSLSRSRFLSQLGLVVGAIPLVSLTYGMWRNPYRYQIHQHKIPVKQLPEDLNGLRIVQISDIHSGTFNRKGPLIRAVELINELKPDLVFFTGDLVNYTADEMEPYISVFKEINAKYGTYSVLGNHDYGDYQHWPDSEAKKDNFRRLQETHRLLGWDLLRNEHRIIEINGRQVGVIGVENSSASARFPNYGDLASASEAMRDTDLKILLSHDPSHWNAEVTRSFQDIHLTLSGHTHGFQFGIEIPGWLKWSPSKYVYKQWAGMYQEGDQHLYVNRGFGMLGYPGRVGILPEITCIEFFEKDRHTI